MFGNRTLLEPPKPIRQDVSLLDLAFCIDCTGSMGTYIENARNSIKYIVEEIIKSEKSHIRLALVEYRDHPPEDNTFVSRKYDFTESSVEMKQWLNSCSASGGGDCPEALADGLNEVVKLSWRIKSTKICILIADAPPHGLIKDGDNMPNGCPCGLDPLYLVREMAQKGIILYTVGCEPAILSCKDFFVSIACTTGGQYVPLKDANSLAELIIGGVREEISLEKLIGTVENQVQELVNKGLTDKDALTEIIHKKLLSEKTNVRSLKLNNQNLEAPSANALKFSKFESLSELKPEFIKAPPSTTPLISASVTPTLSSPFSFGSTSTDTKFTSTGLKSSSVLFPSPLETSNLKPCLNEFSVETDLINKEQTKRLVQKALKRNNIIIEENIESDAIESHEERKEEENNFEINNNIISKNRKCLEDILESVQLDNKDSVKNKNTSREKSRKYKNRSKTLKNCSSESSNEYEKEADKTKKRSRSLERDYVKCDLNSLPNADEAFKSIIEKHVTTLNKLINQINSIKAKTNNGDAIESSFLALTNNNCLKSSEGGDNNDSQNCKLTIIENKAFKYDQDSNEKNIKKLIFDSASEEISQALRLRENEEPINDTINQNTHFESDATVNADTTQIKKLNNNESVDCDLIIIENKAFMHDKENSEFNAGNFLVYSALDNGEKKVSLNKNEDLLFTQPLDETKQSLENVILKQNSTDDNEQNTELEKMQLKDILKISEDTYNIEKKVDRNEHVEITQTQDSRNLLIKNTNDSLIEIKNRIHEIEEIKNENQISSQNNKTTAEIEKDFDFDDLKQRIDRLEKTLEKHIGHNECKTNTEKIENIKSGKKAKQKDKNKKKSDCVIS